MIFPQNMKLIHPNRKQHFGVPDRIHQIDLQS